MDYLIYYWQCTCSSSLNEMIIGSYCKKPDAIIFYRFEIVIFSLRYKNPYFKNLSKNGRNSIVNISKTKSRRYIFLCIFGKSMSKLTKSRIFMKKSIGNPYCIVFLEYTYVYVYDLRPLVKRSPAGLNSVSPVFAL